MSEKCLYCSTPIEQKEGKRERRFCSPSHCTMYNLREKNKDKPKGKAGRPAGSKNKFVAGIDPHKVDGNISVVTITKKSDSPKTPVAIYHSAKDPMLDTKDMANKIAEHYGASVKHETPKWDFSKVVFLNVEDFTEYPKKDCPPNGFQRTEYLLKKKEADDKIREAFQLYKK